MEGRVLIPSLTINADLSFPVDTGADSSLISPADGYEVGLDYDSLAARGAAGTSLGLGGLAQCYTVRASIALTDPGRSIYVYHVDLDIAVPNDEIIEMPSLLGREILDRLRMVYDPSRGDLSFTVRTADITLPV